MVRRRWATVVVALGLVASSGCFNLREEPLFPRFRCWLQSRRCCARGDSAYETPMVGDDCCATMPGMAPLGPHTGPPPLVPMPGQLPAPRTEAGPSSPMPPAK